MGVRLIDLAGGDRVVGVAKLAERDDESDDENGDMNGNDAPGDEGGLEDRRPPNEESG